MPFILIHLKKLSVVKKGKFLKCMGRVAEQALELGQSTLPREALPRTHRGQYPYAIIL